MGKDYLLDRLTKTEGDLTRVMFAAARAQGCLVAVSLIVKHDHPALAEQAGEIVVALEAALFPKGD
jgi:hypothetical protein